MTRPARLTQSQVERAIKAAKRQGETFIYFLRAGDFVKIGQSRRWRYRMATMQTGSPYTIVPLLVIIDKPSLEKKLHARFRADHFRGEWFHSGGEAINRYIKENLHRCVAKTDEADVRPTWDDMDREIIL